MKGWSKFQPFSLRTSA